MDKIKPQVASMRVAFLSYLSTCLSQENQLQAFSTEMVSQMVRLGVDEQAAEAQLKSINGGGKVDAYFDSFMNYLAVTKSVELGNLYLEDVSNILSYAALAINTLEKHPSSAIRDANKKLGEELKALDSLRNDLRTIAISIEKIAYGLKQLRTASHYFGIASCDFMQASLPDIKRQAMSLKPNEYISQDDIQFVQGYLSVFEQWQSGLREQINSVDKADLLKVSGLEADDDCWGSPVYAASREPSDAYVRAYKSVAAPAQSSGDKPSGYLARGWDAVKSAVHGVQNTVGGLIDQLGRVAYTGARNVYGDIYGNTRQEVVKDLIDDRNERMTDFKKGLGGAQTYKNATKFIHATEDAAGDAVKRAVDRGAGKMAGHIACFLAKNTVRLFTSFAKGVYAWATQTPRPAIMSLALSI